MTLELYLFNAGVHTSLYMPIGGQCFPLPGGLKCKKFPCCCPFTMSVYLSYQKFVTIETNRNYE